MFIYVAIITLSIFFIKYAALKTSLPRSAVYSELPNIQEPPKMAKSSDSNGLELLDLPDLALECILEKLSPASLCTMACVCTSMKERCVSNHLWETHMKQKWGQIMGEAAYREWRLFITSRKDSGRCTQEKQRGLLKLLNLLWSAVSHSRSSGHCADATGGKFPLPADSIMSWFLALETGRFWFPAQVYNRENGHVGFMLSCYDADLSYDPRTDTFQARYPAHGRRAIAVEHNVTWERIRAPTVNTLPHDLHVSCSLNDLKPQDHIEIQWRKNKEFPYGWWYGVVGHLESCGGNEGNCHCHDSDTLVLEFRQYSVGSRWRTTAISRKDHLEQGNEIDGFYGGVRKLYRHHDISSWMRIWPSHLLE